MIDLDSALATGRARRTLPPPAVRRHIREAAGVSQRSVARELGERVDHLLGDLPPVARPDRLADELLPLQDVARLEHGPTVLGRAQSAPRTPENRACEIALRLGGAREAVVEHIIRHERSRHAERDIAGRRECGNGAQRARSCVSSANTGRSGSRRNGRFSSSRPEAATSTRPWAFSAPGRPCGTRGSPATAVSSAATVARSLLSSGIDPYRSWSSKSATWPAGTSTRA